MKAQEIMQAAQMFNTIFAALKECEKVNKSNNYNSDYLFVECAGGTHYTNELCDIMPSAFSDADDFYRCKTMEETAAKFAELCLAVGCTPSDIYTSY